MASKKLQLTALEVFKEDIWILLIIDLLVFTAGLRVQDRTLVPSTNWPFLLSAAVLWPGLYFATHLTLQLLQGAADAERERTGNFVFPGMIGYRVLFLAVVALFAGLSIDSYYQGDRDVAGIVATSAFSLMVFHCWPRSIEFSNGAIRQKRALGGMKEIPFSGISSARFDARWRCIVITGQNGIKIVHSKMHAGQKQFAHQFKLLTGIDISGLPA
jgi:hypothetical protein